RFGRLVAVEPPAEADAEQDHARRCDHQQRESGFGKSMQTEWSTAAIEKGSEPRPCRRSDDAERNGKEGKNRKRHRHHARALVRRMMAAPVAEEDIAHLARHIKGRKQRAE